MPLRELTEKQNMHTPTCTHTLITRWLKLLPERETISATYSQPVRDIFARCLQSKGRPEVNSKTNMLQHCDVIAQFLPVALQYLYRTQRTTYTEVTYPPSTIQNRTIDVRNITTRRAQLCMTKYHAKNTSNSIGPGPNAALATLAVVASQCCPGSSSSQGASYAAAAMINRPLCMHSNVIA